MSVATLRYDAPAAAEPAAADPAPQPAVPAAVYHQRGNGSLSLSFERQGSASVLGQLYQRTPCRALFPRPPLGEPPVAVLITTSGGLAGGDRLAMAVRVEQGASATITTQAAEKVYRSLGPDARVDTKLVVAADATLEWLPQETILFDGACLDRHIVADIAEGGRLLACETLVFGRAARGEVMTKGRVRETWRLERGGSPIWIDRIGVSGDVLARLDDKLSFGGARAMATALYAGPDAARLLDGARERAEAAGGGATIVNGVLVARVLGVLPERVRAGLATLIAWLREAALGHSSGVPALWAV